VPQSESLAVSLFPKEVLRARDEELLEKTVCGFCFILVR
jgi:hypothetical protein